MFQEIELQALDRLQRQLPHEPPDERLLVVAADAEDIGRYGNPLPDGVIAEAIERLNRYEPRAIGLDLARDLPQPPGHDRAIAVLSNSDNVVSVCAFGGTDASQGGISRSPASGTAGKHWLYGFVQGWVEQ